jgi:hypothetical protein
MKIDQEGRDKYHGERENKEAQYTILYSNHGFLTPSKASFLQE